MEQTPQMTAEEFLGRTVTEETFFQTLKAAGLEPTSAEDCQEAIELALRLEAAQPLLAAPETSSRFKSANLALSEKLATDDRTAGIFQQNQRDAYAKQAAVWAANVVETRDDIRNAAFAAIQNQAAAVRESLQTA